MELSRSSHDYQRLLPQRIEGVIGDLRQRERIPIGTCRVQGSPVIEEGVTVTEATRLQYEPLEPPEHFGPCGGGFLYRWFHVELPRTEDQQHTAYLEWDCDGEHLVYAGEQTWAGINVAHRYTILPENATDLFIETGLYQTGIWLPGAALDKNTPLVFRGARLLAWNEEIRQLAAAFEAAYATLRMHLTDAGIQPPSRQGYIAPFHDVPPYVRAMLAHLAAACDAAEDGEYAEAAKAIEGLKRDSGTGRAANGAVALMGHSHLDLAWLWPRREADRKARRSLATMLRLSELYPHYRQLLTTPWHIKHLEQSDPELMGAVRAQLESGRWELSGATSIESDTILSGELGFVRSLQRGQRLFREMTGSESGVFMAPDMFGFPSTLPKILSQAHVFAMFTTKLSWSQLNWFPHTQFRWRHASGGELLVFQSPVSYNTDIWPAVLRTAVNRNVQSGVHPESFLPFGHSDGGGGPTEEMVTRIQHLQGLPGVPELSYRTAEQFFSSLQESAHELPSYEGELYLEMHRGTYSSQHATKRAYNGALAAAVVAEAARAVTGAPVLSDSVWDEIIWHQFHDVLPGTSIPEVHTEAVASLEHVMTTLRQETAAALAESAGTKRTPDSRTEPAGNREKNRGENRGSGHSTSKATAEAPESGAYFWPLPVPGPALSPAGAPVFVTGTGVTSAAEPLKAAPTRAPGPEAGTETAGADAFHLQNDRIRVSFGTNGMPAAIEAGPYHVGLSAVSLVAYPDNPAMYHAWEIEPFGRTRGVEITDLVDVKTQANGPDGAAHSAVVTLQYEEVHIEITYRLFPGDPDLHLFVRCDWPYVHKQLRLETETDFRGGRALYGEPFGAISRSQSSQAPQADAAWEVPGHQWAALPAPDLQGGTALIAKDRYGFSAENGRLGVTLIHPSDHPDPTADQGEHRFHLLIGPFRSRSAGGTLSTAQRAQQIGIEPIGVQDPAERFPGAGTGSGPSAGAGGFGGTGAMRGTEPAPATEPTPAVLVDPAESLVWYSVEAGSEAPGVVLRAYEPLGFSGVVEVRLNRHLLGLDAPLAATYCDLLDEPVEMPDMPAPRVTENGDGTHSVHLQYAGHVHFSLWIGTAQQSDTDL